MATYHYKALNSKGQSERGTLEAPSEKEALRRLREQELYILTLGTEPDLPWLKIFTPKISMRERIIFTRQLAVMVKAGLSLLQALQTLKEQSESKAFRKVIAVIAADIQGGAPLSKALAKHPQVFPNVYISIVESGEKSGKLENVLQNMADQLEKDYDLVSSVKGAMIYPIIVLIALIGVILLIIFFIMPQLKTVFSDMGAELPLVTRIILTGSEAIRRYFIFFVAGLIAIIILIRLYTRSENGRLYWDKIKLRVPVFGLLSKKICLARFSRTMAMLIEAGLPMLEVIQITANVINNSVYQYSLNTASQAVSNGKPLSVALKEEKNFPPMVVHLLDTGEQSGNLEYVLSELANFYDKEVANTTRNLSSLIEPILMIIMGLGVGLIVASVLSPIYNLVSKL